MHASTHACTPAPHTHACTHSLTQLWYLSYTRCAPYLLISLRTHAIALSIIYANFLRTHTIIASITTHVMCIVDTTIIVYDTHKRSAPYWFISSREFCRAHFSPQIHARLLSMAPTPICVQNSLGTPSSSHPHPFAPPSSLRPLLLASSLLFHLRALFPSSVPSPRHIRSALSRPA
jgi:hypothetical protein